MYFKNFLVSHSLLLSILLFFFLSLLLPPVLVKIGIAFLTTHILGTCFTPILVSSLVFILFHVILVILGLPSAVTQAQIEYSISGALT